jgi:hypothetical protein
MEKKYSSLHQNAYKVEQAKGRNKDLHRRIDISDSSKHLAGA